MRSLGIVLALVTLSLPAVLSAAPPDQLVAPQTARLGGPRVRPADGRIAALIIEGLGRSERLRQLIDRVEQSDVIVYIETQPALRGRIAGSLTWVTKTEHYRYLRISISPDQFGESAIALLAHELQHAVEVANAKSVVDSASLEKLYRSIGRRVGVHTSGWDTDAAGIVGDDVRRELALNRHARTTESIQAFDPRAWYVVYRRARERAQ